MTGEPQEMEYDVREILVTYNERNPEVAKGTETIKRTSMQEPTRHRPYWVFYNESNNEDGWRNHLYIAMEDVARVEVLSYIDR